MSDLIEVTQSESVSSSTSSCFAHFLA